VLKQQLRLLLAVVAVALGAGCQVRTELVIDVQDDGSGTVEVAVSLDPDAMSRVPGLADELRLDDLTATGWEITGPAVEDDGYTWIRASKGFASPEQAAVILAELTGPDGPISGFAVTRDRSFARTEYGLTGVVDLTGGLEAFADEQLAVALGGVPLGESVAEIEARIGVPIDEAFTFRVAARLPGELQDTDAPAREGTAVVWEPRFSDAGASSLSATSELVRTRTLSLGALALVAAVAAVLVGVVLPVLAWRRRRRLRPRGRHGAGRYGGR